jgi:DNA-binding MarR family transcriptional regulator
MAMMNYEDLLIPKISKITRLVPQLMEVPLKEIDISMQEFRIVGLLIGEEGISQKDLAKKLLVKPSTLSVAISGLEGKGYINRKVSPTDKRVNFLTLDDDADLSNANNIVLSMEETLIKGLSKKDVDITRRVLGKMLMNLESRL